MRERQDQGADLGVPVLTLFAFTHAGQRLAEAALCLHVNDCNGAPLGCCHMSHCHRGYVLKITRRTPPAAPARQPWASPFMPPLARGSPYFFNTYLLIYYQEFRVKIKYTPVCQCDM